MLSSYPIFTATPQGILVNGLPLAKSASAQFSASAQRYVHRAQELLETVRPEDWDDRTPHDAHHVPTLAKVHMLLALASPQPVPFGKFNPYHLGPGLGGGQFTTAELDGQSMSFANLSSHYPTYKNYPSKPEDGKKTIWQLIDSGFPIPYEKDETLSGKMLPGDTSKTWYYFRIKALADYLSQTYGKPTEYNPDTWKDDAKGKTGIVFFKVPFSDASGHMELFDGKRVLNYDDPDPNAHHDYTDRATNIFLWRIK